MLMDIRLHLLGLLFLLLEPVTLEVSVEGYVGGDVVLPCSYSDSNVSVTSPDKGITFDWRLDFNAKVIEVFEGETKFDEQDKQFENRAALLAPQTGDFSVKLTNLNEKDFGKYTCTVPDLLIEHAVTLKETPSPEPKKNSGNSSMTMGPQKTLSLLNLVLLMILSV